MRPPLVPAELRAGPFTTAQALAAGLTHSALRHSEWRQVLRGVWAHVTVEDTREFRFAAARLVASATGRCLRAHGSVVVRRGRTPR